MFKGAALGLLALVGAATPGMAQVFTLSINGVMSGTRSTTVCGPSSNLNCMQLNPGGVVNQQFLEAFDAPLYTGFLAQGANAFTYGSPYTNGLWSGTIINSNGYLTGQGLSFSRLGSGCQSGSVGCETVFASASIFNVAGGVPEPGTWATMLLGFALAGVALQKNARRSRLVTQ